MSSVTASFSLPPDDPHDHLDHLVRRARTLLGAGCSVQAARVELERSDPFPPVWDVFLAIKAAEVLDR